jgi:hypothetical protein
MRRSLIAVAAASVLATIASVQAQAMPRASLPAGAGGLPVEKTQFIFGGREYCFYPAGWHGPGFYFCGYAWRRGFGWGGPVGWRGWRAPRRFVARPAYHGPRFHGGWHGGPRGGYHGGRGGGHGGPGGGHGGHGGGHHGGRH